MFEGFSPETFDFLWGIRLNNNREWFLQHKEDYLKYLYEPLRDLGRELYEPFSKVPGLNLKVSRIYRDTRLHHPDPYKEDLWFSIQRPTDFWSEHPTLYLDVDPYGISYGLNLWRPKPAAMAAFRKDLEGNPKTFEKILKTAEKKTGSKFEASSYKRPKPCERADMGPWYNWKGDIACSVQEPVGEGIFSRSLVERAGETLQALLPALEYFQKFTG